MSPKDKAIDLVDKFRDYARHGISDSWEEENKWATETACQIAIITVHEIMEVATNNRPFWLEVIQEIENL